MFFFFFLFIKSLYIVQTNNSTLHFILNSRIQEVKIPHAEKNKHKISGDIIKSDNTDIVLSSRRYIDSIQVTSDGNIFIDGQSFTVDSIIEEPRIVNNVIFQTHKRFKTSQIFDVVVFIVFLDLNIVDTRTMCNRSVHFSYIYHPFSSAESLEVCGNILKIKDKIYTFPEDVIAVYNTKDIDGVKYMNRLFFYSGLEIYHPRAPSTTSFFYFLIPLVVIFLFYWRQKTLKLVLKLEVNDSYTLYEGLYLNKRVLVKWYKKRTDEINNEISMLYNLNHTYISKLIYYENNLLHTFTVFEYSEMMVQSPSKDLLHQIVLAVKFLNERRIYLKNFNPKNVRMQNGHVVLFDVCSKSHDQIWYCEEEEDDGMKNVVFLGCLLHYFITGHHPYDLSSLRFINAPSFEVILNPVSLSQSKKHLSQNEDIKTNILLRTYKIRVVDPLTHDLIYHTIKNKVNERTNIVRLAAHPYFWDASTTFEFIARYSDLLEGCPAHVKKIERNKARIFTNSWDLYLSSLVAEELSVFRLYNYNSAKDLVRVIRNKGRHYGQTPDSVKEVYKSFPEGFVSYWCNLFPGLLIVCYNCGYSMREDELLKKFY